MSTRAEGGTVVVLVNAKAMLSAGTVHLVLSVLKGPAPGTWRYNLREGTRNRFQYGHVTGITGHLDVLRYAAGICKDAYQPGTIQRGLLEQFANDGTETLTPEAGA